MGIGSSVGSEAGADTRRGMESMGFSAERAAGSLASSVSGFGGSMVSAASIAGNAAMGLGSSIFSGISSAGRSMERTGAEVRVGMQSVGDSAVAASVQFRGAATDIGQSAVQSATVIEHGLDSTGRRVEASAGHISVAAVQASDTVSQGLRHHGDGIALAGASARDGLRSHGMAIAYAGASVAATGAAISSSTDRLSDNVRDAVDLASERLLQAVVLFSIAMGAMLLLPSTASGAVLLGGAGMLARGMRGTRQQAALTAEVTQQTQPRALPSPAPRRMLPPAPQIGGFFHHLAIPISPPHALPQLWQIQGEQVWADVPNRLKVVDIGRPSRQAVEWKSLLLVGPTGAGKTSWLEFLVNHIAGVTWGDQHRYCLFEEGQDGREADQACSQTQWVTAYRIHWQEGFQVPFSLLVVDTPGLDSTAGIDQDKMLDSQLRRLFQPASGQSLPPVSVCGLNAICPTFPATTTRVAASQTYVLSMLRMLFSLRESDRSHFLLFATFADSAEPSVKSALESAGIPFGKTFKFNNSALHASHSASAGEEGADFERLYWDMVQRSFRHLMKHLSSLPAWNVTRALQALED